MAIQCFFTVQLLALVCSPFTVTAWGAGGHWIWYVQIRLVIYIIGKLYDMYVCHNQNPILDLIPSLPKLYHWSKTGGIFEIAHCTFEIIQFINTDNHLDKARSTLWINSFKEYIVHSISNKPKRVLASKCDPGNWIFPKSFEKSLGNFLYFFVLFSKWSLCYKIK